MEKADRQGADVLLYTRTLLKYHTIIIQLQYY